MKLMRNATVPAPFFSGVGSGSKKRFLFCFVFYKCVIKIIIKKSTEVLKKINNLLNNILQSHTFCKVEFKVRVIAVATLMQIK